MAALSVVVLLATTYTVAGIGMPMSALTMTQMAIDMPGMIMGAAPWSPLYALLVFLMWWIMMIAMMIPSAAPTLLLYAGLARKNRKADAPYAATWFFLAGYLTVWGGFSLIATVLQWGLGELGVMSGMMEITQAPLAASTLIVAGLYQLTPVKRACLRHCQHPLIFLLHHWKPGAAGAFRMGVQNGWFCLGCCWMLMVLLFVGGVMNLLWIAGIALLVALEKLAAGRDWLTVVTGGALIVTGGGWLASLYLPV